MRLEVPPATSVRPVAVRLFGRFEVTDHADVVDLPSDAQRLVAFLALEHRRVPRSYVAGRLWLESSTDRAFGNLRSALWRVRNKADGLVLADQQFLSLTPDASIDTETATAAATRLCGTGDCPETDYDLSLFGDELLPGWYDDWTIVEREMLRQQSFHALESMATRLSEKGAYWSAIQAALAAIKLDPLRESAHRCLIGVHIAEGNHSEARRQFDSYAQLIHDELGLEPSPLMSDLVHQRTDRRSGDAPRVTLEPWRSQSEPSS